MNRIYTLKRQFSVTGIFHTFKVGERFYEEQDKDNNGEYNYYPLSGFYPLWSRNMPHLKDMLELEQETDKPKEYYINKKYTQEFVDQLINNDSRI